VAVALGALPEGIEWGVERREDGSLNSLLALKDTSLWRITASDAEVVTDQFFVEPATAQLTVTQRSQTFVEGPTQRTVLKRDYRVEILRLGASPVVVKVEGRDVVQGGFSSDKGPDQNERFGRALAEGLGWGDDD
jgi:hypothetical protein